MGLILGNADAVSKVAEPKVKMSVSGPCYPQTTKKSMPENCDQDQDTCEEKQDFTMMV